MINRVVRCLLCLIPLAALAAGEAPEVTLWVIPVENASPNNLARGEDIRARVEAFNKMLEGSGVTVLNTVDPVLSMRLVAWNPAFAVPNAAVVMSQQQTLEALKKFASRERVRVRVRFITWDEAFGLLADLNPDARSNSFPDVVQVGSTWVGYVASKDLPLSRPHFGTDLGNWQPVAGLPAAVLPYITDVRLLFYWKRLPSAVGSSGSVSLNSSSWESLIDSIRANGSEGDTLAMPTGLTLNLLHDYAPLIWSGLSDFVIRDWFGTRVDLSSERALKVPRLLLDRALIEPKPGEPRRLVAFPESSHEEADGIFVNGGYRAIIEPANFIGRWRQDFDTRTIADLLNQLRVAADADSVSPLLSG